MLRYRQLESTALHAGPCVRVIDEFTGGPPLGPLAVELDVEVAPGQFVNLGASAYRATTASDVVIWFPWLEHYRDARGRAPRSYRFRVRAKLYAARYQYDRDGEVLPAWPYDDDQPPAASPLPLTIGLLPSAAYPFPASCPVLHGAVVNTFSLERIPNALVRWNKGGTPATDVLTDADGEFALPLRWAPIGPLFSVDAEVAPNRWGTHSVQLPQHLPLFHTIKVM